MKRFYDFFKGDPAHDALVLKIVSKEGQRKIAQLFLPSKLKIWICEGKNSNPDCMASSRIASIYEPICCNSYYPYLKEKCQYWGGKGTPSEQIKPAGVVNRECPVTNEFEPQFHIEIEKICKQNGRITGYADVMFSGKIIDYQKIEIEPNWIWEREENVLSLKIVVDAKPTLSGFGGPLRQLKTYMDCLDAEAGVLATYSTLSDEAIELLRKEAVHVVKFDKPDSSEGLRRFL